MYDVEKNLKQFIKKCKKNENSLLLGYEKKWGYLDLCFIDKLPDITEQIDIYYKNLINQLLIRINSALSTEEKYDLKYISSNDYKKKFKSNLCSSFKELISKGYIIDDYCEDGKCIYYNDSLIDISISEYNIKFSECEVSTSFSLVINVDGYKYKENDYRWTKIKNKENWEKIK